MVRRARTSTKFALRLSFFLIGCGGLGAAAVGDARGRLPGMLGVSGDCSSVGDVPAVAGDGIAGASPEVATDMAVTGLESALGVVGVEPGRRDPGAGRRRQLAG